MDPAVTPDDVTRWVNELWQPAANAGDVVERTRTASRVRGWLDAVVVDLTLAADRYAEHGEGAGADAALQGDGKMSAQEAAKTKKRARLVKDAPAVGDALRGGRIGSAHADALARALGKASAAVRAQVVARTDDLMARASAMTPEAFERYVDDLVNRLGAAEAVDRLERQRQRSMLRTWTDRATGMICGRFELDTERGTRVVNALRAETELLWSEHPTPAGESADGVWDRLAAQALVNLIGHAHSAARPGIADIAIHIDHRTWTEGWHPDTMCELADGTPIPIDTVRRLACCANIYRVVIAATGEVLDMGRETRTATRAQRRALRAMYRTCVYPDCTVTFDRCEIHHVHWWEHHGPSDLDNLVPVCWRHHHLVHDRGWTLHLEQGRTIHWTRPDGTPHATIPLADIARSIPEHRRPPRPPRPPGAGPPGQPPDTGPPRHNTGEQPPLFTNAA